MSRIADVHTAVLPAATGEFAANATRRSGHGVEEVAGRIPQNVLAGLDKAASVRHAERPQLPGPVTRAFPGWGFGWTISNPSKVADLDQAESMAQDAFAKFTNPNANFVDKLRAEEEMDAASQLRQSIEPFLTPKQQQALDQIENLEKNAMQLAHNNSGFLGPALQVIGKGDMLVAAAGQQSLESWILSQ